MLLCTQKNGSINKILCLCIWEFWQNVLVNCCLQIVESLISTIMNKMEMLVCLFTVFHSGELLPFLGLPRMRTSDVQMDCHRLFMLSSDGWTPVLHASSRFSWAFLLCMHHLIGFFKEKKAYPSHFSGNLHGRIQLLDNYRQPAKRFPNACLFFCMAGYEERSKLKPLIWKAWAPQKYKLFAWLITKNRVWTSERLVTRSVL